MSIKIGHLGQKMIVNCTALLLLLCVCHFTHGTTPSDAYFYNDQLVDHVHDPSSSTTWSQRYYTSGTYFSGPGKPIFVIIGGEGAIEPSTGLLYPFVTERLAETFSAYVIQPEHRFYGASQPLGDTSAVTDDDLARLMTTEQAMWDAVRLIRYIAVTKLGCSLDRSSNEYCMVITVGGSYPGFVSAMMRHVHPHAVDIAYAASAPMKFYSQDVHPNAYYDHISRVADACLEGCAPAVQKTLLDIVHELSLSSYIDVADKIGVCPGTIPAYIQDAPMFQDEIMMVIAYTFANYNMAYYPPDNTTKLYQSCQQFLDTSIDSFTKVQTFLSGLDDMPCFNMTTQLPFGKHATISGGDWSGVGTGWDGNMWDFQTCYLLIEQIGFSHESMFPMREWTFDWLFQHCEDRFGITPRPYELVQKWGFDDLATSSYILFTNGDNDGWSVSAVKENVTDMVLAINFENGAHHSDLSRLGPSEQDTEDITWGFDQIEGILGKWIHDLNLEYKNFFDGSTVAMS